jgi:hypothetical protein
MKPRFAIREVLLVVVLVALVVVVVVQGRRIAVLEARTGQLNSRTDDLDTRTRKMNRSNVGELNKFLQATHSINKYYLSLKKRVDQLEKGAAPKEKPAD